MYMEGGESKDKEGNIDAMRGDLIGSYLLTATIADSNVSADTTLKFGTIALGTGADDAGYDGLSVTHDGNENPVEMSDRKTA